MLSKLDRLVLPTLEYRQTPLREIIEDIRVKSREVDPDGDGVNIITLLDEAALDKPLTVTLRTPTVGKALQLVCSTSLIEIRYEPNAILLVPAQHVAGRPGDE